MRIRTNAILAIEIGGRSAWQDSNFIVDGSSYPTECENQQNNQPQGKISQAAIKSRVKLDFLLGFWIWTLVVRVTMGSWDLSHGTASCQHKSPS